MRRVSERRCISNWPFLDEQLRIAQRVLAIGNQECIMAGLVGLMSPRGLTSEFAACLVARKNNPAPGGRVALEGWPRTDPLDPEDGCPGFPAAAVGLSEGQASW